MATQTMATIKDTRRNIFLQQRKPGPPAARDLTVTFLQTTATAITSPVYLDGNNAAIRYSSCGVGAPVIPAGGSWMGPRARSMAGGDVWGTDVVDFNINTADFELRYQFIQGSANLDGYLRVYVDDVLTATWQGPYVADQYWVMRIVAPTRRTMHVRVESNMGKRELRIGQNDQAWKPKKPLYRSRWYFKGDSWTAGAQDQTGRTYVMALAERLGVEALRGGYSSTGYTTDAGTKLSFPGSVTPDIVPQAPNAVMIFGSINDSTNVSGVQAAAKGMYDALAAQLPAAPVIVVGPQDGLKDGPSTALCDSIEAALQAAVAQCPNVIGYISTKGWVTGDGKVGTPATTTPKGNGEVMVAPDGIHPTAAGHEWVADRLYEEITALIADRKISISPM
jgi:lysophospholipase L1-like esterase